MQTERNIAEGVRFIYIMAACFVHGEERVTRIPEKKQKEGSVMEGKDIRVIIDDGL